MRKRKKHHRPSSPPRVRTRLNQVSTPDLLAAFDSLVEDLCFSEAEEDLKEKLIPVGREQYPLGESRVEILAWGTCHGIDVPEPTSRDLRELRGKQSWPHHSQYFPGTYKQAAAAVLAAWDAEQCAAEEQREARW